MSAAGASPRSGRSGVAWRLAAVASLGVLILLLHGQALRYGLFMDDFAHVRQLRECGWSLADLTNACRLELVGGAIKLWWLPDCTLRFFRPVAFGLMKLTYVLTGWSPAAMHAASLLWHLAACTLLMVLLRRLGASSWLAWAVAALSAIHPAQVATVQWIACQTELMVTTFLLGATLCFARFRGWPGFMPDVGGPGARPSVAWGSASAALFALALGCRENAILFPLVVAAVEPLLGRPRVLPADLTGAAALSAVISKQPGGRAALSLYAVFGAIIVGYLALRSALLGGAAMPPRPYVITPGEADFPRYVFDKAWYYLLGEFLAVPCVPIAGLPYFQERPLLFYGLAAGVGVLLLGVCVRFFRRPPGLLGPAWLLGFMVPVLPVFASPHHLYLPGVGWAVIMALVLRGLGWPTAGTTRVVGVIRRASAWLVIALLGTVFSAATLFFGLTFETGQRVQDCLIEELTAAPRGLATGDTLYVANLPLLGHYVRLAVEDRTGLRGLRVVPLTWAPRILGVTTPTELRWIDDRTIEVRVAGDRYFAGPLARLIQEASGRPIPDSVDRSAEYGLRVRVVDRDADGIRALRFEFDRPLSAPGLHLFWGSRARWAYELPPPAGPE